MANTVANEHQTTRKTSPSRDPDRPRRYCPTHTFLETMLGRMLRQRAIKSRRRHRVASKKPDQGWSPGGRETFMSALFPTVDGRLQSAAPKPYQARMLAEQRGNEDYAFRYIDLDGM